MRAHEPLRSIVAALAAVGLFHAPAGLPSARAQLATVPAIRPTDRDAVLDLYRNHYLASENVPPAWTGSLATGAPGTLGSNYLCATLRRINYFRAMSGLPGNIALDPQANAACQQAALMMAAEGNVSHDPPSSWRFYTRQAALAANHSNLALDTRNDEGPGAIDRYIADDGPANALVGHRRWLLYAGTTFMAVGAVPPEPGSHPGTNVTWVLGGGPAAVSGVRLAVAWPPAGYVPAPLVCNRWSFSYPNADFSRATVRVTKNGVPVAVARERVGTQSAVNGTGVSVGNNTLVWTLPGNLVGRTGDEAYQVSVQNVAVAGTLHGFDYPVTSIPVVLRAQPPELLGLAGLPVYKLANDRRGL